MDRTQLLLVGLPLFLFFSDIFNLFSPPPSKPAAHHHHQPVSQPLVQQQQPSLEFPAQKATGIGFGNTVSIDFCSSCSYRGTAVTMKNMLENQFPGINVALANYPPPLPKRMLSKLSSGAFEVYCNGELVFSKLKENRFPGEIELKDLVARRIASSRVVDGLHGGHWS
ncbi:UNVERIFIED_CONTAM: SelT-like protein [Sesamum radiatum]|uniref:SelT-like protein n=1 Tax=Sesamum radiatum TaxID=300843 RepID=A0AAW2KSN9_SESRA